MTRRSGKSSGNWKTGGEIDAVLREWIICGRWCAGDRLPPRLELLRSLKTTQVTLHHSIQRLVYEGFLRTSPKSGTFVADTPPHLNNYAVVFVFDPVAPYHEQTWSRHFKALTQAAVRLQQETGKRMMMFHGIDWHADSEDRVRLITYIERQRLAGIIFTTHPFPLKNTPILDAPGIPRVAIMSGGGGGPYPHVPIVNFDTSLWLDKALDHLAALGRRRVAMIDYGSAPSFHAQFHARLAKRGMVSHPSWIQLASMQHQDGARRAVELLMRDRERPDALLIEDDNFVEQALAGLAAAGVKVPEEVAVVGHANFPVPPAKVQPVRLLGYDATMFLRTCVDLIDRQRAGEPVPGETILPALWEEEVSGQWVVGSGQSSVQRAKGRTQAGKRKMELAV